MARIYSIPFQQLSVSAKQDLWAITTGASLQAVVEEVFLDPCATAVNELALSFNLFTGAYASGTSGSTATIARHDQSDAAPSFTAKLQNTGQTASGSGGKIVLRAANWQLVNGYVWQPQQPAQAYVIPVSACLTISLDTAPSAITVAGNLIVREGYY